jgi:hypothetical protein
MRARRSGIAVATFALVALLAAPAPGVANDSAMGGAGGAVTPIGSTTIRMKAETVQVLVYQQFAEYRVDFQFENSGAPQKVKLGFPFPVPVEGDYTPPAAFRAWQGDKPLAVTYEETPAKDMMKTGYYLHEADFPTGVTMISVSYFADHDMWAEQPPEGATPPERFKDATSFWGSYPYQVSTGAGWAGTIGQSTIRYYVTRDALLWGVDAAINERARMWDEDPEMTKDAGKVLRQYKQLTPGVYQWTFTDFEPTPDAFGRSAYDIDMPFFIPYGQSEFAEPWMPVSDVKASSELRLDGFEYPAANATDGNPSTAWAEGASGSGTGQTLTISFPRKTVGGELRVLPGYAKTEALFRKYNRPKTLDVEFSDGKKTTFSLSDEPVVQRFLFDSDAEWAKVTIGEVYRGTTRDETYISEIEIAEPDPSLKMLSFEEVLAGKVDAASEMPPDAPQVDDGRDYGDVRWKLLAQAGGCAVLLGLLIGGTIVIVQRRAMARRNSPPVEPPSGS